jgi:hypothetical protein
MNLVKDYVDIMPLGPQSIKGLADQLECFRVVGWKGAGTGKKRKPQTKERSKTGMAEEVSGQKA